MINDMKYKIQYLPRKKWKGFEIIFKYKTTHYFEVTVEQNNDEMSANFCKMAFDDSLEKEFVDKLYEDYWDNAKSYGLFENDKLIACLEISKEVWSNRLRITELWVDESFRRMGIGTILMNFAKKKAEELKCRAIILETQTCNVNAIDFYLKQGFELFGFDRSFYSNDDLNRKEIRLELGIFISK